jgi:hypothetical protein
VPNLLFRGALLQHTIRGVPWRAFVRGAQEVLLHLDGDTNAWERVAFARDIGRRHLGELAILDWPDEAEWFKALNGVDQLTALAHVVQSAADANLDAIGSYAQAAEARLADVGPLPEALRLQGAVGRAYAAVGAFGQAALSLGRAVDGWFDGGRIRESSHALSELLRVVGVQRDADAVRGLQSRVDSLLSATPDAISGAFIKLALGRALLQSGQLDDGRAALGGSATEWEAAPLHAQAARLRWLHFADLEGGNDASAERHLDEFDALNEDGAAYDSAQRYLSRIDRALSRGTVVGGHVESLLAAVPGGHEAARTLSRLAPLVPLKSMLNNRSLVARMAWEYRY